MSSAEMVIAKLEDQVKSSETFVKGLHESLNVTQLQVHHDFALPLQEINWFEQFLV